MTIRSGLPSGQCCNMQTISIFSNYKQYGFAYSITVVQPAQKKQKAENLLRCLILFLSFIFTCSVDR